MNKLKNHLLSLICKLLKIDNISYKRIVYRDDILRIGSDYGGWAIPSNIFDANSVCYCVGCGEDISFDLGMIKKFGCKIFGFDPTPRAISYVQELTSDIVNYHFSPLGLWDSNDTIKFYEPANPKHVSHSALNLQNTGDYIELNVDRLANIMRNNHHASLDLLKIDIEGAEYKVITSLLEDKLEIKVLCVEFDEWNNSLDSHYKKRISSYINNLATYGYSIVDCDYKGNYTFLLQNV